MDDTTITALPTAATIDATQDWLAIDTTSLLTTQKINRNTFLEITGSPVGTTDTQAITNKTVGNTNTVTLKDTLFTLQDDGDTTKQAKFQLSGITTATTRTYTLPNASSTLADIATAQTFTNKTLTSPVVNGGSIDNSTITVDSIAGHTTPTTGSVYGVSVTSGTIGTAGIANSAVTFAKAATGFCVQQVSALFSAAATGTTTIPLDDTIPQITEGTEFMTVSITPKSASNILVIAASAFLSVSVNTSDAICALFQDATANALAAQPLFQGTATAPTIGSMLYTMTAGTTSSTTFRFRVGGNNASTVTFNGQSGTRQFGTAIKSSMVVMEFKG